jgi:hypothetical protein
LRLDPIAINAGRGEIRLALEGVMDIMHSFNDGFLSTKRYFYGGAGGNQNQHVFVLSLPEAKA